MFNYTLRRLLLAIPTLLFIALAIFLLLELSPGDPMADMPLTIPPEVREQMRLALGLGEAWYIRFFKWLYLFSVVEPSHVLANMTGLDWLAIEGQRIISFQTRSPVGDIIAQRLPQTLWVVGLSYIFGIMVAVPIGIYSAYRQYSWFDQAGTFISMVGFSLPTFFTGPLLMLIFSIWLGWFPIIYDTTLVVDSWYDFGLQLRQMAMPVFVLTLYNAAQITRFMRASMLDNLTQDYVRTARSKGMTEKVVVLVHVLRNSMIPVITVIALGIPTIFTGAIITEQIFRVNGLGALLITAIYASDIPMVLTLSVVFAILIVLFNLIADLLYAVFDPRIRYD
ncbi:MULTISPECIES: ABC transporter permease [Pararhodobacter]|uniref:ABC transporter substrate-binding protein n=1 Tax=Pararhodobacter aggregans TaxID=404875 RepID=A0A2T7UVB1_9RHOB|nr:MULTISPECIES: ABC transporter permease [Pararhodobacter]PTX04002.1 peptide/nickel transport system permease protein [Pararhodobacter aggregans]PVE48526.1 ABC transporter substrate-binding protein [Pararhodobacter aggregans]